MDQPILKQNKTFKVNFKEETRRFEIQSEDSIPIGLGFESPLRRHATLDQSMD